MKAKFSRLEPTDDEVVAGLGVVDAGVLVRYEAENQHRRAVLVCGTSSDITL
jgi:hypothetical protein